MSNSRRRSSDERESARIEREARRAGREPEAVGEPPSLSAPGPEAEPESIAQAGPEPGPTAGPRRVPPASFGGSPDGEIETVSGTRRAARRERPVSGASRASTAPQRSWRREESGGHSRAGRVLAALTLVLAGVLAWFLVELFQPFHSEGQGSVTVTVPAHTSSRSVGDLLARAGVVSSGFFFELRALLADERSNLRAGTYRLRRGMSYGGALASLTTAPAAARVTDLTIREGRTRRGIAALLHAQGIPGDYLAATRRSPLLDGRRYGAPSNISTLEGFLFPSTYQLREPINVTALVADQLTAFRQRFATVSLGYAHSKGLSPYEVLTIASMIEGEAQVARDRPLIASVVYNRLRDHMPLQIDATVRYATGNYMTPITVSQLRSGSPYNTYVHQGLPPGPIDNPGLASIQAAANPAVTNYLYFDAKPCGNGEHAFASTYRQFLADANRYQAVRAARGGRSPTHC